MNTIFRKPRNSYTTLNIDTVISARLNHNSNQRILSDEFDLVFPNMATFKDSAFLNKFKGWSAEKKKRFYYIVGGLANIRKTAEFMDGLLENVNKE